MTRRGDEPFALAGPAGTLEAELHRPPADPAFRAVVAHPHPLYGGTMDNGVVMLTARAVIAAGGEALRFNFRGVGASDGEHDEGRGERLDLAAAIAALDARRPALPLLVAGYSFGAVATLDLLSSATAASASSMASAVGAVADGAMPVAVLLIAPPVTHYRDRDWKLGSIPTVVIYGDRDGLTPPPLIEERAAAWGSTVRCVAIPNVGHDLGTFGAPRPLEAALQGAVASLMRTASSGR